MSAGREGILKALRPWAAGLLLILLLLPAVIWVVGPHLLLYPVRDQVLEVSGVKRGFSGVRIERLHLSLVPGMEVSLHRVQARMGMSSLVRGHWDHLEAESWEARLDPATTSLSGMESALSNLYRLRASSFSASAGVLHLSSRQPVWKVEGAGQRRDGEILEVLAELHSPLARLDLFVLLADSALESSLHFEGVLLSRSQGADTISPILSFLSAPIVEQIIAAFSQLNLEGTIYLSPRHQAESFVILFNGTGRPLAADDPDLGHQAISGGLTWRRGEPRRLVVDLIRAGDQWGDLRFGAGAYEVRWREDGPLWIYTGPLPFTLGPYEGEVRLDIEIITGDSRELEVHATANLEWTNPPEQAPRQMDAHLRYRFDDAPVWTIERIHSGIPQKTGQDLSERIARHLSDFPWKDIFLP